MNEQIPLAKRLKAHAINSNQSNSTYVVGDCILNVQSEMTGSDHYKDLLLSILKRKFISEQ